MAGDRNSVGNQQPDEPASTAHIKDPKVLRLLSKVIKFPAHHLCQGQPAFVYPPMAKAPRIAREHQFLAARHACRPFGLEASHALRIVLDLVEKIVAIALLADEIHFNLATLQPCNLMTFLSPQVIP